MAAGSSTVTVRVVLDEGDLRRLRAHRSAALEESIELVAHILGKEPSQVPIARAVQVAEFIAAGGDYDTEAAMATVEPVEVARVQDFDLDAPVWVNDGPCACRKCEEPSIVVGDLVARKSEPDRVYRVVELGSTRVALVRPIGHVGHTVLVELDQLERL